MPVTFTYSANTKIKSSQMNTNLTLVYEKFEGHEQIEGSSPGGFVNFVRENQIIQRGFFWQIGSGTNSIDQVITFPVEFDDKRWDMFIQFFGTLSGSNPGSRAGINGIAIQGFDIPTVASTRATTGITLRCFTWNGSNTVNTVRYGFSWMAIGIKA